jgi:hypothetical protein
MKGCANMKLVFSSKKEVNEKVVSMACSCRCQNTYSSAPGMRIPHKR